MRPDLPTGDRYPGARPFQDSDLDRKIFRGREGEAQRLLHLILAEPWVLLYGRSGVGKSSLLNAGVMAELRQEAHLPLRVRLNDPAAGPLRAFFGSLDESARLPGIEYVPGDAASLCRFFATAEFWAGDTLLTPVIVFDQFEELFTLHTPPQRQAFADELARLVRAEGTPAVKVVCSIREDFLGDLEELAPKIPSILTTRFRLTSMPRAAAARAIEEPAGLVDPDLHTTPFEYGTGVVDAILDFLGHRKEAAEAVRRDEIEPFQLQIICRHVESVARARQKAGQARVVIDTQALGGEVGLRQVLERFYEDEVARIAGLGSAKALLTLCEHGLISPRGRRLSLEEGDIEARFKVAQPVLAQLVDRRILRAEPRVGSVYYELSHDSLIAPILASRERRSRAHRSRRKRVWSAASAAVLLALGGYYYWQFSRPERITVSHDTTHITSQLKPNGLPDYAAAFNARYGAGVTPENNAAVDLLATVSTAAGQAEDELRLALGATTISTERTVRFVGGVGEEKQVRDLLAPAHRASFSEAQYTRELRHALTNPWSDEECPLVTTWLAANERALAAVRDATRKPHFWIPATPRGGLVARQVPNVGRLRNVANAFRARALRQMRKGQFLAAGEELEEVLRLGALISRGPSLFEKYLGSVLAELAHEGFAILSSSAGLTAAEAQTIVERLHAVPRPDAGYAEVLDAERWATLEMVVGEYERRLTRQGLWRQLSVPAADRSASAAASTTAPDTGLGLPSWAVLDWDRLLRELNHHYDGSVVNADRDDKERERNPGSLPSPDVPLEPWTLVWRVVLSPRDAFTRAAWAVIGSVASPSYARMTRSRATHELASASLALASYRAGKGGFPRRLPTDPAGIEARDENYRLVYRPLQPSGAAFRSFALAAETTRERQRFPASCVGPTGRMINYPGPRLPEAGDSACPDAPGVASTVAREVMTTPTLWRVWWSGFSLFHGLALAAGVVVLWWLSRMKARFRRQAMVGVTMAMALVAVWPLDEYRRARAAQDELKRQVEEAIRLLQAKLTADRARDAAAVTIAQDLRRVLPAALDLGGFTQQFGEVARLAGVTVAETRYEREPRESFQKHEQGRVWLRLRGSPASLAALKRSGRAIERLVWWREERTTAAGLETSVEVFALPEPGFQSACDAAALYPRRVQNALSECCATRYRRRDLGAACGQLASLADQVLPYEARQKDLLERQSFVEALRKHDDRPRSGSR